MDSEKLIEQLRSYTYWLGQDGPESHDIHPLICDDAATALSTLQAENEKLRAELERKNEALDFARTKDAEIVRLGTELERVKRENNALWTYIEIVDREYRRYMDRGYIDRLDELKKVWKRGQKED